VWAIFSKVDTRSGLWVLPHMNVRAALSNSGCKGLKPLHLVAYDLMVIATSKVIWSSALTGRMSSVVAAIAIEINVFIVKSFACFMPQTKNPRRVDGALPGGVALE
jgi:hypothetical protein